MDPVPKLEISDTLQISQEETEALDNVNIVYTESTAIKDSEIFATGRKIHSVKEANELYKKPVLTHLRQWQIIAFWYTGFPIHRTNYRRATGMTGSTERDVGC